jgi:hypothetical protein
MPSTKQWSSTRNSTDPISSVGRGGGDQGGCPGRRRGGGAGGGALSVQKGGGQGRRQGGLWGAEAPRNVGWGPTPGVYTGEWKVGGGVVGGVWKKCEKLLKKKKKKSRQNFSDGNFWRLVCVLKKKVAKYSPELISPYALGGAKFISSPWAQKSEMASYGPGSDPEQLIAAFEQHCIERRMKSIAESKIRARRSMFFSPICVDW